MLKTAHTIVAYLIVLLGIAHQGFTFVSYSRFSFGALWFIGSGLAIIFAGFLNIVLIRNVATDMAADKATRLLCLIANATTTLLFALALRLFREPQVFVGLGLFALATISTLMLRRTISEH